jgi:hypothetical protein
MIWRAPVCGDLDQDIVAAVPLSKPSTRRHMPRWWSRC